MQDEEEKFSDDPTENMKIENEFLKIKMKAQYGDGFFISEGDGSLPPEIENQFLKQMIAFEQNFENAEFISLYEKIGSPDFKNIDNLQTHEIADEIKRLTIAMEEHGIMFDINHGPYPDEVIYKFITEELFEQEVEKESFIEGGNWHFSYEEFYPNNKIEIEKNTNEFLQHWFTKEMNEYCTELAYHFVTNEGLKLDRSTFFKKVNMFFDSFIKFKNEEFTIDDIKFELHDNDEGVGHTEGKIHYDAEMENGEIIQYKGTYKLYMQREDKYWSIMYFEMPGFVW
jgi:hypothetical protein